METPILSLLKPLESAASCAAEVRKNKTERGPKNVVKEHVQYQVRCTSILLVQKYRYA